MLRSLAYESHGRRALWLLVALLAGFSPPILGLQTNSATFMNLSSPFSYQYPVEERECHHNATSLAIVRRGRQHSAWLLRTGDR